MLKSAHVWNRFNLIQSGYKSVAEPVTTGQATSVSGYPSASFDSTTGIYTPVGTYGTSYGVGDTRVAFVGNGVVYQTLGKLVGQTSATQITYASFYGAPNMLKSTAAGEVASQNRNEYPDDGIKDGFYYVYTGKRNAVYEGTRVPVRKLTYDNLTQLNDCTVKLSFTDDVLLYGLLATMSLGSSEVDSPMATIKLGTSPTAILATSQIKIGPDDEPSSSSGVTFYDLAGNFTTPVRLTKNVTYFLYLTTSNPLFGFAHSYFFQPSNSENFTSNNKNITGKFDGVPENRQLPYLYLDVSAIPNSSPSVSLTIPTQSAQLGTNKTVNLSNYFSDPDGDVMTYTASLGNPAIGAVSVNGSTLTLTPKVLGSTTITVTANDGKGGTKSTTFTFSVTNSAPTVNLTAPTANQTLYENDVFNITGTASDTDNNNSVTIRYQINANTVRAIKAFVSDGTTLEAFSKSLRFSGGSLYDGETLIASGLTDGVAHKLKVWATDDQGGQSVIVERDFYVVPNRAPRLEVTPPVIDGVIDSDTFTIAGTYADADKNETVISYRINGSASKEVARGTSGTFDFTLSLSQLTVGQNTIVVDALDSYGAKTSRTIKLHKNTIATPLLQSTVRYLIQPPKGSAQAVLLWLQRDQDLAVTASLHMGMKGEAEAFTLLEPTNTAPLRDNAAILEDEFYHEADSAKDHIILQLDMLRSSVESTAAIHLISGVFE